MIYKCKMCGGTLEITNKDTVGVCEYCGTKQTLPRLDNNKKANLYERAAHFRQVNDYDAARVLYEQILAEDKTDAEAYWSIVLCRYGIEYVEDPTTHKRIPTVNRAQYTSIFNDSDYKQAIQYADPLQSEIYEQEAKAIDDIQKGILKISKNEKPFDIFICYKESDENGRRTIDSVLAYDIYKELVEAGYKVFFSRITLEDKVGTAYEPYIFAALNSAPIMLVIGTKKEYFNAIWVKNEWSRFLGMIKAGAKKTLIPMYKDMSPYDLPEEFAHLQAQDMNNLGYIQDLLRGIKKIIDLQKGAVKETVVKDFADAEALMKRGMYELEDKEWENAKKFFNQILNHDPENGDAYIGLLLTEMHLSDFADLSKCNRKFDHTNEYKKAIRFADPEIAEKLKDYSRTVNNSIAEKIKNDKYVTAKDRLSNASTEVEYESIAASFKELGNYLDSYDLSIQCEKKAKEIRIEQKAIREKKTRKIKTAIVISSILLSIVIAITGITMYVNKSKLDRYETAITLMKESKYDEAMGKFQELGTYKDSTEKINECKNQKERKMYWDALKMAKEGDIVRFGYDEGYIEWLVVKREDESLFLISKECICKMPANEEWTSIEWKHSSLRKWLNESYKNKVFSKDEQNRIVLTKFVYDGEVYYRTPDMDADETGNLFLLLPDEAEDLLSVDERKLGERWWLGKSGKYENTFTYVNEAGEINTDGIKVTDSDLGVRPAIWIDISDSK